MGYVGKNAALCFLKYAHPTSLKNDRIPFELRSVSARVPGVGALLEQMNSLYSNRVAKNEALPSPLKKEMKSQPIHTNNICITVGVSELGTGARSGSSTKALIRAFISKYLFSS